MSSTTNLPPIGAIESEVLDFKAQGYASGDSAAVEISLDIAQFANTRGGTIVLGANEENDVLTGYAPIADVAEQEQKVINSSGARLSAPAGIEFDRVAVDGGDVLLVHVAPSIEPVGVRTRSDSWRFPHRVGSHRKYWPFWEVQGMDSRTRRGRLLLDKIPDRQKCTFVVDAILDGFGFEHWRVADLQDRSFALKGQGMSLNVPYSYVEEATEVFAGHYVLTLDCRITRVGDSMAYVHKKELRTAAQQLRDRMLLERQRSER